MFSGSLVALVTPFKDGAVDFDTLRELVDWHVEAGTHGIVPCGTTGESATLSHEEHEEVIGAVVQHAAGRIKVVAGTGSNNTAEAVSLTRSAAEVGADGALLITPYYNKPTQAGLIASFAAVAEASDLPLILYNVPGRTGVNMLPATVIECARRIPTVVGIKEASGSIDQAVEILREVDESFALLSGDDSLTLPLMAVGATGVISVAANVVPREMVELVNLLAAGDYGAARQLHFRLFPLFDTMFVETNPIPVKAAMRMQGRIGPEIRLPMTPISEENEAKVEAVLRALDILPGR